MFFKQKKFLFCRCNIPFYNLSIKTQKMLLFLLMRCVKPVELSIGDVFVASHTMFAAVSGMIFFTTLFKYSLYIYVYVYNVKNIYIYVKRNIYYFS